MLKRLMQCLVALLVALAFGAMPTLALASDATPSPPAIFDLAPEAVLVSTQINMPRPLLGADRTCPAALEDYSYESLEPAYPLLN
jgi:hypothetical protein